MTELVGCVYSRDFDIDCTIITRIFLLLLFPGTVLISSCGEDPVGEYQVLCLSNMFLNSFILLRSVLDEIHTTNIYFFNFSFCSGFIAALILNHCRQGCSLFGCFSVIYLCTFIFHVYLLRGGVLVQTKYLKKMCGVGKDGTRDTRTTNEFYSDKQMAPGYFLLETRFTFLALCRWHSTPLPVRRKSY